MQTLTDLAVGISQTCQCRYLLLARSQRSPYIPELVVGNVLGQASGQQVRDQFIYRTALVLGKCGECSLQAFANLIRSGTGIRTRAYQGQEAIQDRHGGDYSRTKVLSQVKERNCLETVAPYLKIMKKGNKNEPSTALSTPHAPQQQNNDQLGKDLYTGARDRNDSCGHIWDYGNILWFHSGRAS